MEEKERICPAWILIGGFFSASSSHEHHPNIACSPLQQVFRFVAAAESSYQFSQNVPYQLCSWYATNN